jgi:hypothetical protein
VTSQVSVATPAAIKTVAHQGTWHSEGVDQRLLGNSCTSGRLAGDSAQEAKIYASENKHASYLSTESCDTGGLATHDHCSRAFTLPFNVHNVGEDHHRRVDALDALQFPFESAWSTTARFSGGMGPGHGDAGLIRGDHPSPGWASARGGRGRGRAT